MNLKHAIVVALCFPYAGCSADAAFDHFVQRDSTGVTIAESSAPRWRDGQGWRVAGNPDVVIGTADGDPESQLFEVRGVRRLDDGSIVVANTGAHEVRVFSASGNLIRSIGREGSGPGEFRWPSGVWLLPGDSLAIADFERLSVFREDGTFAWSAPRGPWPVQQVYPGGVVLNVVDVGAGALDAGAARPLKTLVRRSIHEPRGDTLIALSGDEVFYSRSDAGGVSTFYAPFGARRLIAVRESGIVTGDGSSGELVELTHTGVLARIMRWAEAPVPVTRAAMDSLERSVLEEARNDFQRERRNRLFREWSYPAHRAIYDRLLADADGHLWLRKSQISSRSPSTWTILDPAGQWLGEVSTPPSLDVHQVGRDYVLGVMRDELGVETVRVYHLTR